MIQTPLRPRAWLPLLAWVAGAVVGLLVVKALYAAAQTDFEAVTLAKGTTTVRANVGSFPIHCEDDRDWARCVAGAKARGVRRVALWLGNSQLHAINQFKPGDVNATPLLHDALLSDGLDLITISVPNANLQEHAVDFAAVLEALPLDTLVLPVVFDDMREDGVRAEMHQMLQSPAVQQLFQGFDVGRQIIAANKPRATESATGAIRETVQEVAERRLTALLDVHSPVWHARAEAQGQIFLALYRFRNAVFNIKPQTARRMIPARYNTNFEALRMTLDIAKRRGVRVVLYVAPIRNDLPTPYFPDQYARLKREVGELATQYGTRLVNLESLVPAEFWGTKDSTSIGEEAEVDYMHFQAGGHRLLAQALASAVRATPPVAGARP